MTPGDDRPIRRLREQYQATPEDRARIWAKLHEAASSSVASDPSPRVSKGLWLWTCACLALALGGTALYYRQGTHETNDEGSSALSMPSATSAPRTASEPNSDGVRPTEPAFEAEAPGTPIHQLPSTTKVEKVAAGRDTRSSGRVVARATPESTGTTASPATTEASGTPDPIDTLEEETRLLRSAIRTGDKARALELLEEHAARFPRGELAGERDVQRVLALCALGRTEEARSRAQSFLAGRAPDALTNRIHQSCARR